MKKILLSLAFLGSGASSLFCGTDAGALINALITNLSEKKDSKQDADALIVLYNSTGRTATPLKVRNALNGSEIADYKGKIKSNDDIPKVPAGMGTKGFGFSNKVKDEALAKYSALAGIGTDGADYEAGKDDVHLAAINALVNEAGSDSTKKANAKKVFEDVIKVIQQAGVDKVK